MSSPHAARHCRPRSARPRAVPAALALLGAAAVAFAVLHQQRAPQPTAGSSSSTVAFADVGSTASPRGAGLDVAARSSVLPVRVDIPVLGVRSRLLSLGLAPDGTMAVPLPGPRYDEAGWYRYSPAPGSVGPAVLVGHVDSRAQGPSVFFALGSLHRFDLVRVTRADGSVATFSVDAVRRFPKASFPTALVYGDRPDAELRLLTCGGPFDRTTGHYTDNVVVLAHLTGWA